MSYDVTYVLGTTSPDLARKMAWEVVDGLVRVNVQILQRHPRLAAEAARLPTAKQPGDLREIGSVLDALSRGAFDSTLERWAFECAIGRLKNHAEVYNDRVLPLEIPNEIKVKTGAFGKKQREMSNAILGELLEALVRIDVLCFQAYPNLPRLYQTGVYYQREPLGQENWLSTLALYRRGKGDCEDLASTLTAEKRFFDGRAVTAGYTWRNLPSGITLYHIIQKDETGATEDDPSRKLGMLDKDG